MKNNFVAIPSQQGDGGFVELARTRKGRLFKKQILGMNSEFSYPSAPGGKIRIDKSFAETLRRNFKSGVCDIVQVPIVDDGNAHSEDPTRNIGEVVDLTYDDAGVYAVIDARKHADDLGETLLGASALMHMNYSDTSTGEKKGPTLLHVAVTNRPYLTNLSDFQELSGELAALSADTQGEAPVVLSRATQTEDKMDKDELLALLKDEHGIDVAALQEQVALSGETDNSELLAALSNVLTPGAETLTIKDVADAVVELAEERVELSNTVQSLKDANESMAQKAAEAEVDGLIEEGRILPKQRDRMVALSRNDRETFEDLLPDDAIVSLSETGVLTHDAPVSETVNQNIERLASIANGKSKK